MGSSTRLSSTAGALQTRYDYNSYGKLEGNLSNPSTINFHSYTGREDDLTGLYYYRNRYYDPNLESFISDDPLGDNQRYVGGNPLRFIDPLGLYGANQARRTNNRDFIGQPRTPDFYSLNISSPGSVGIGGSITIDRYGRPYFGGNLFGGKSPESPRFSGSLSAGWLGVCKLPQEKELESFLKGNSGSACGGYYLGACYTQVPDGRNAIQYGLFTPQVGGSIGETK